jgi:hypothetical protein
MVKVARIAGAIFPFLVELTWNAVTDVAVH